MKTISRFFSSHSYLLVIIFLSFFPLFFFLTSNGLVHTHDGLVHLPRLAAFFKALSDLQLPVRFAADINYGYGLPLFTFIYHTPYLIGSLFLFMGFGLVWSFKLSLTLSFLLSGIFMYLFAREFFGDEKKAFFVALLYQFAPFHLIDLLIRGSYGEVYTYAFLPLVLFGLVKLFVKKSIGYFIVTSIATALLVLSHNSISLLFFGIAVLFVLVFAPSHKLRIVGGAGLGIGLFLVSFYWIPAIIEHQYTHGDTYMQDLFRTHFPSTWKFLVPNVTDIPFLQTDNLSLQFGLIQLLSLIAGVILALQKKLSKIEIQIGIFSLILIIGSFFWMSSWSLPLWEQLAFLRQFQFPWRFLAIEVFVLALSGVFLYHFIKKNTVFIFVSFCIVLTSVSYWIPKEGIDRIKESYYWNFPLSTTYYGETDVIWTAGPAKAYPRNRVEVIAGDATVSNFKKKSNKQTFMVDAKTDATIVSHTTYFPGWRVYVDGKKQSIEYQDQNYRGEITFPVTKGNHQVVMKFEESAVRLMADIVSVLGGLGLLGIFVFRKKLERVLNS